MKQYTILILFLMSCDFINADDDFFLSFDEVSTSMSAPVKKIEDKAPVKKNNKAQINKDLKKQLDEANKLLESYRYVTHNQIKEPIIYSEQTVNEADIIGGENLLTIRATNYPTKTVISNLKGTNLPSDSKIVCDVYSKYKRACGHCSRLIVDGVGYDIDASLNNRDGSSCVIGELSDDGETYLAGVFISEMAKGAAAISQSSIPTIGGNVIEASAKNKILQGLINTSDESTDYLREQLKTKEPIVLVKQRTNITIYFNKGVSL